jgi:hypothetical protein
MSCGRLLRASAIDRCLAILIPHVHLDVHDNIDSAGSLPHAQSRRS